MNNIKNISIINDGLMKRMIVTYDVINDDGKVVKANQQINRIVMDNEILQAIGEITNFAESIIDTL